jgi:hypothetical protein
MNILEAVYAGEVVNSNGQAKIHKQRKRTYAWDMADANIFVCPKCSKVWQRPLSGGRKCSFYEDFPTIGKKRVVCPKCV